MNELGRYRVVGRRAYRGHQPGEEFEARLDENVEARAVQRGNLVLLERLVAELPPGKYRLPVGWPGSKERE